MAPTLVILLPSHSTESGAQGAPGALGVHGARAHAIGEDGARIRLGSWGEGAVG